MRVVAAVAGLALIVVVFIDGFEAMILPRRVTRRLPAGAAVLPLHLGAVAGRRAPAAGRASGATAS